MHFIFEYIAYVYVFGMGKVWEWECEICIIRYVFPFYSDDFALGFIYGCEREGGISRKLTSPIFRRRFDVNYERERSISDCMYFQTAFLCLAFVRASAKHLQSKCCTQVWTDKGQWFPSHHEDSVEREEWEFHNRKWRPFFCLSLGIPGSKCLRSFRACSTFWNLVFPFLFRRCCRLLCEVVFFQQTIVPNIRLHWSKKRP